MVGARKYITNMPDELKDDISALQQSVFLLVDTFEKKHGVVVTSIELYEKCTVATITLPVVE